MSNANTPEMMAQSMAESLLRENKALKEQNALLTIQVKELYQALEGLRNFSIKYVCYHDETHRGGTIWEICDGCGAQWADDKGGKPEFKEPIEITRANAALTAITQQVKSGGANER